MSILEAIILGIIQGLTEFLPVSSSGHLELGKAVLGVEAKEDVTFTVVVHGATVLSTIVVFHKDIWAILKGLFQFKHNAELEYVLKIGLSMVPVGIVGLFFKDQVESFFNNNVLLVGSMLLVTGGLLAFTYYAKRTEKQIGYGHAFIVGLAQAIAVLPGISRSGSTIATGLLLGVRKEVITRFSFLMVLVPIIGANVKDIAEGSMSQSVASPAALGIGFVMAFVSGVFACKWMIRIVNQGKLIWFAVYCFLMGGIAILSAWL